MAALYEFEVLAKINEEMRNVNISSGQDVKVKGWC